MDVERSGGDQCPVMDDIAGHSAGCGRCVRVAQSVEPTAAMIYPTDSVGPDVLIVDAQGDSSEVLSTVLRRRGLRTAQTSSAGEGLSLIQSQPCHVAVVEMEGSSDPDEIESRFRQLSQQNHMGLVLVGDFRTSAEDGPSIRHVDKPYRFDQLIRTIEELVKNSQLAE